MKFLKVEGIKTDTNRTEQKDRHVMREQARKIALKTDMFNRKLRQKAFFYVSDTSEEAVRIGVILREHIDVHHRLETFLQAIAINLKDTCLEEVTLNTERHMLQIASRNEYIDDDDEVLEQFGLDKLTNRFGRSIKFGENILEEWNKASIYANADRFLVGNTLIPELDRIYTGSHYTGMTGHPVHYMVQTDDRDTRQSICHLLLQALYANHRLSNKRYTFLDFRPGEDFSAAAYDDLYKSNIGGAVTVRYLADDDTEEEYAACGHETIEVLCETMKKYRHQVLTVFCLPRECTNARDIFYENLGNSSIVELKEEFVSGEHAERFLKMLAKDQNIRTDKRLFAFLEEDKGYLAPDLHNLFDNWYNSKLKTVIYPQYREIATTKQKSVKASPKGPAYEELMDMIGLTEAKKVIRQALDYYKAQKLFADKGMALDRPAMHMVFTGNPGTAKTTVARLFAQLMRENNLLSKGTFIEVGRGDLVGKYVGWTAPTIQKKFKAAQGGVLFIDEAYSLVEDRDGSFGDEAINTIVQEMENHRKEVVVIFAGYPDKMEGFLKKNPGLRSRIAFHVPFSDYDTKELCAIADRIAAKKGLVLTSEASDKLSVVFEAAKAESDFGNGRYVRNVMEKARMAQASRLLTMDVDAVSTKDIMTIYAEDIEMPVSDSKAKRTIGFCT